MADQEGKVELFEGRGGEDRRVARFTMGKAAEFGVVRGRDQIVGHILDKQSSCPGILFLFP